MVTLKVKDSDYLLIDEHSDHNLKLIRMQERGNTLGDCFVLKCSDCNKAIITINIKNDPYA